MPCVACIRCLLGLNFLTGRVLLVLSEKWVLAVLLGTIPHADGGGEERRVARKHKVLRAVRKASNEGERKGRGVGWLFFFSISRGKE
jgi:hypothetical protein